MKMNDESRRHLGRCLEARNFMSKCPKEFGVDTYCEHERLAGAEFWALVIEPKDVNKFNNQDITGVLMHMAGFLNITDEPPKSIIKSHKRARQMLMNHPDQQEFRTAFETVATRAAKLRLDTLVVAVAPPQPPLPLPAEMHPTESASSSG